MSKIPTCTWTQLPLSAHVLERSCHAVCAVGSKVFIFGGETRPRQAVDDIVHIVSITNDVSTTVQSLKLGKSPLPRVAATIATGACGGAPTIFVHGGRDGPSMLTRHELGVWTLTSLGANPVWTYHVPTIPSAPSPRSNHSSCATPDGRFYVHAGRTDTGRTGDFWEWNHATKKWTRLSDAPGPAREGTALCFCNGKIWRYGGYDGRRCLGENGEIDVYDPAARSWSTIMHPRLKSACPGPRSGVQLIARASGKLLMFFGEREKSLLGDARAENVWSDVWIFDTRNGCWREVEMDADDEEAECPEPRGCFGAAACADGSIVMHGGSNCEHRRLGDAWVLDIAD